MSLNQHPKLLIGILWVLFLTVCLSAYGFYPQYFSPENIAQIVRKYSQFALVIYFLLSVLRGFTLIPSTPFVIAGGILFPERQFLVLLISIISILISALLIYFFSDYLGLRKFFNAKKVDAIKKELETPKGILYVFLWSFFPAMPTDAVCYVAGTIKMNVYKFIAAVFFGELIICTIYIYCGVKFLSFLLFS